MSGCSEQSNPALSSPYRLEDEPEAGGMATVSLATNLRHELTGRQDPAPWVGLVLAGLIACGGTDGDGSFRSVTVTDSAGIRIVQNSAVPADARAWAVHGPILEIGRWEGDAAYELFGVRGAQRLSDGRIVIANDGSHQLRFYDSTGRHELSVGGEGDGPGEFRAFRFGSLRRFAGDSLLILDAAQSRLSVFDPAGRFVRSLTSPEVFSFAILAGVFPDGSALVYRQFDVGAEMETGVSRPDVEVYHLSTDGSAPSSLGSFPGPENYMHVSNEGWARGVTLWYGRSLEVAVADDRVVVAPTDRYELRILNRDGKLRGLVRMEHDPVSLRPADFDSVRNRRLRFTEDAESRDRWAQIYDAMPRPPSLPAFRSIMADADGNLWVQDYTRSAQAGGRWTVFDREGRALGKVVTPDGMWVTDIGSDYLLGVVRDELGVEGVQLWGLAKDGPAPERPSR